MTINFSHITKGKEFILGEEPFYLFIFSIIAENYGIIKILLGFCLPHSNKFLSYNKFFSHARTDVGKKISLACQYTNLDSPVLA